MRFFVVRTACANLFDQSNILSRRRMGHGYSGIGKESQRRCEEKRLVIAGLHQKGIWCAQGMSIERIATSEQGHDRKGCDTGAGARQRGVHYRKRGATEEGATPESETTHNNMQL